MPVSQCMCDEDYQDQPITTNIPVANQEPLIPEFTPEELEEFKKLNGIEDTDIVTDKPIETKVKKVKVSKPKSTKKPTKNKTKK
jgi:hypothetical protein